MHLFPQEEHLIGKRTGGRLMCCKLLRQLVDANKRPQRGVALVGRSPSTIGRCCFSMFRPPLAGRWALAPCSSITAFDADYTAKVIDLVCKCSDGRLIQCSPRSNSRRAGVRYTVYRLSRLATRAGRASMNDTESSTAKGSMCFVYNMRLQLLKLRESACTSCCNCGSEAAC